jgi:hypothetical protein
MYKKVFISKSNEATFVCPKCDKTKTVDVSKYQYIQNKITCKSRYICGYSWASLLERRRFYRVGTDIPCTCSKTGAYESVENISMKVVDLSPDGLKLESVGLEKDPAHATFFKSPFTIGFNLGENNKIHVKKTVHPIRTTKTHVCAEFDEPERGGSAIISYMLRHT